MSEISYKVKLASIVLALTIAPFGASFACPCDDADDEDDAPTIQQPTTRPQASSNGASN